MEEGCSAPTDPATVVKAFRSLASTLDVYEDGGSDSTGLDIEAIARRKDALGNLAAMLSQALSSCSDMSAGEQLPVSEWSCCQTASIATRITKLADSASEPNVGRPTCTGGARTLWWMVNGMYGTCIRIENMRCVCLIWSCSLMNFTFVVPHCAGTGNSELHSIGQQYTKSKPNCQCDGVCSCQTLRRMVALGLAWAMAQALLRPAPEQRASTPCQMQARWCFMATTVVG